MRKVLALIVAPSLLLLVAGCGGADRRGGSVQSAGHDLNGRELRIAVENAYPPFNFVSEDTGEGIGWDYDACRAMCEVIDCRPVFVEVPRGTIVEGVAAREYDMAANGLAVTLEREELVDFSAPYMLIRQVLLIRADEVEIVDEPSLVASDAIVGVQMGTLNEQVAHSLVGEDRVRDFDTFDLPVQALVAGDVDAVLLDEPAAGGFVEQYVDQIRIASGPIAGEERRAFAFPPGSDLIEPVDYAIGVLTDNGTLEQLYEKWWGQR
jgi:polar amino acid transport system substrate-binding protein